jgi:Putative DNA-binding domain
MISSKPIGAITEDDIKELCADQVSEGTELELKSDLPHKDGLQKDAWHSGGGIGDRARNEIAEEIVAFANTNGGVLCLGIDETADHPKRALSPRPLPRVHELARRLWQAVHSIIEPPLPVLETIGVDIDGTGGGVVVLRVPPSRRRPHRQMVNKEVFIRRGDETARLSMREIQELTIQAVSETTRVEATIKERRQRFRQDLANWLGQQPREDGKPWGGGLQLIATPTVPLELGRVVGRPRLIDLASSTTADLGGHSVRCAWPSASSNWRPGLRSIMNEHYRADTHMHFLQSLATNGECEISMKFAASTEWPGVFAVWLMGGLGKLLTMIERVRTEANSNVEFALAPQIDIIGRPASLMGYGAQSFSEDCVAMPVGVHEFPIASVGPPEEFAAHLQRFDEDCWDIAGYDTRRRGAKFVLTLD